MYTQEKKPEMMAAGIGDMSNRAHALRTTPAVTQTTLIGLSMKLPIVAAPQTVGSVGHCVASPFLLITPAATRL